MASLKVTNSLTFVSVSATNRESRSVKDAFGRGYSRMRSECGARARKDTVRSRAASGIMLSGTTAGAGGAFPGLGQVGAGNTRLANVNGDRVPYVDGPLLARVGSVRIEAIAIICPVCCRGHT